MICYSANFVSPVHHTDNGLFQLNFTIKESRRRGVFHEIAFYFLNKHNWEKENNTQEVCIYLMQHMGKCTC